MDDCRRAVIFANGELLDIRAAQELLRPGDLLIAADGGARHAMALGLVPRLLVGDLDSLTPGEVAALEAAGTQVCRYPAEKDETDLELALILALDLDCGEILVVGGLGGRMDQALGNLYLLLQHRLCERAARLDDGQVEAFWIRGAARIQGRPGDTVSLLPLMGAAEGVETEGLRYPLHGETLIPERTRGISNEMLGTEARVIVTRGMLACLHERK
jgi:thiamine pyrophosphokinase